jgi:type VI protein secretion system component VasK
MAVLTKPPLPKIRHPRRVSDRLFQAALVVLALLLAGMFLGLRHQSERLDNSRQDIASLKGQADDNAAASDANADALRQANTKLEAAGEEPVAVPVPGRAAGRAGGEGRDRRQGRPR